MRCSLSIFLLLTHFFVSPFAALFPVLVVLFEINIQKCKANFEESGNGEMNSDNVFVFTEDTRHKFGADKGFL